MVLWGHLFPIHIGSLEISVGQIKMYYWIKYKQSLLLHYFECVHFSNNDLVV